MGSSILNDLERIFDRKTIPDYEFKTGATDDDIANFEIELGLKLPDDFKTFYRFSDGVFCLQEFGWMFQLISLEDIIYYKAEYKPNEFTIAEYMIYSDQWIVRIKPDDPNSYNIVNTNHGGQEVILSNSLLEFLDVYMRNGLMDNGGLYDWYNSKLSQSSQ